jgi:hypothetical protein
MERWTKRVNFGVHHTLQLKGCTPPCTINANINLLSIFFFPLTKHCNNQSLWMYFGFPWWLNHYTSFLLLPLFLFSKYHFPQLWGYYLCLMSHVYFSGLFIYTFFSKIVRDEMGQVYLGWWHENLPMSFHLLSMIVLSLDHL